MNDPRAQQILNSAADRMGNNLAARREWKCVPGVIYPSAEELALLARPGVSEDEIEAGAPAVCAGCGCTKSVAQLRREHPGALFCCPDRVMRSPQTVEKSA